MLVSPPGERNFDRQEPISPETGIDLVKAHRAAHDRQRAGDETYRQRDLAGNENGSNTAMGRR